MVIIRSSLSFLHRAVWLFHSVPITSCSTVPVEKCTDGLTIFALRGTTEPMGTGEQGAIADAVAARIPGTRTYAVPYPATYEIPSYFDSVLNGTTLLQEAIMGHIRDCPQARIAILGYSQGAIAASNALCGAPYFWTLGLPPLDLEAIDENIVAIALFGDPTHKLSDPFRRGTAQGDGIFYRIGTGHCAASLGDRIRSYCDAGDPVCDVVTGDNYTVHEDYVPVYGDEVTEWMIDMFERARRRST